RARDVDLDRVVDHQLRRNEWVDLRRISAHRRHRVAHRRKVDDRRHAREVLHQDPSRREGDLLARHGRRIPAGECLDVGREHGPVALGPQQVLEEDLQGEGKPPDLEGRLERVQAEDLERPLADRELATGTKAVHGHERSPGLGERRLASLPKERAGPALTKRSGPRDRTTVHVSRATSKSRSGPPDNRDASRLNFPEGNEMARKSPHSRKISLLAMTLVGAAIIAPAPASASAARGHATKVVHHASTAAHKTASHKRTRRIRVSHHKTTLAPIIATASSQIPQAAASVYSSASTAPCADGGLIPTSANLVQVRAATLCLINQQRSAAGLAPLRATAA